MIKTILIDDDFLVLQALETILSVQDHIEVVGTGNDGRDAVELYITHQPDLVLMDIRMEPTSGIEAAHQILKDFPEADKFGGLFQLFDNKREVLTNIVKIIDKVNDRLDLVQ